MTETRTPCQQAGFDAAYDATIPEVAAADRPMVAALVVSVLSRYHSFVAVEQVRREWRATLPRVSTTTLTAAVVAAAKAMETDR